MALIKDYLAERGIPGNGLSRVSYFRTVIDFTKNPCGAGDIVPLFRIPKGATILSFGAEVIKPEAPTVADAVMKLYDSGFTALATGANTLNVDVDNTAGMVFNDNAGFDATAEVGGAYIVGNMAVYAGFTAGGALSNSVISFWVLAGVPQLDAKGNL